MLSSLTRPLGRCCHPLRVKLPLDPRFSEAVKACFSAHPLMKSSAKPLGFSHYLIFFLSPLLGLFLLFLFSASSLKGMHHPPTPQSSRTKSWWLEANDLVQLKARHYRTSGVEIIWGSLCCQEDSWVLSSKAQLDWKPGAAPRKFCWLQRREDGGCWAHRHNTAGPSVAFLPESPSSKQDLGGDHEYPDDCFAVLEAFLSLSPN